ncbi:MAG: sel1 repeat family protein, partial [Alphaproteobacteria bacterium]|nr:sel1 repeat family protein [Alphaproteobacteria bacterium]
MFKYLIIFMLVFGSTTVKAGDSNKLTNKEISIEKLRNKAIAGDKEALSKLTDIAELGDATYQYNVGLVYDITRKDDKEAINWYRKAAENGDVTAQNILGNRYLVGVGVPQNYKETVKWHLKAAEQGYAESQSSIGDAYYYGRGISQDYKEAVKWYKKSA